MKSDMETCRIGKKFLNRRVMNIGWDIAVFNNAKHCYIMNIEYDT